MSTTNELADNFSGIAKFNLITEDFQTGITSVKVQIKYYRFGVLH